MIISVLAAVASGDFIFLLHHTGLTDGNLSSHLSKLQETGYVEQEKRFIDKKPNSMYRLTKVGRVAFETYKNQMKDILK